MQVPSLVSLLEIRRHDKPVVNALLVEDQGERKA